ncbi:MAG TPA: potassium transporter Kup [Polyangia bacterium]|nr:potassium transporter Kup [Polyangia bacterium]
MSKLALGALGVVYGDIGTSPLYAVRECVNPPHGVGPTPENILGVLSLIFWSLTLVVTLKYLKFVMRADNHGEGGVLSLLELVAPRLGPAHKQRKRALTLMALFGAALLYGDGMITPAISVLSAVEGLHVATDALAPFVVPLTLGILVGLFLFQKRGTGRVGAVFGPLTLCWFVVIGAAGLPWIIRHPMILTAIAPHHLVRFFVNNGRHGFLILGSIVLCITGAEALYADMGHFGRPAIKLAWYAVVMPALFLNYFGQGALLLEHPETQNPFYALAPGPWLYPMVAIATVAAVVASQALISGAFSLTRQAVQLGFAPRMTIVHTSGTTEGQIFIPAVNNILMVACLALVVAAGGSDRLADTYGTAMTGTMAITAVLFYFLARRRLKWSAWRAGALLALFLSVDLALFSSCLAKILTGGWFPLTVAVAVFFVMTTWKRGRSILAERISSETLPLDAFLLDVEVSKPHRVKGTAVFLTSVARGTPNVLLHHFKHNQVLHEQVVILSVVTDAVPEVPDELRIQGKNFGLGFWAVTAHYGFMQTPNVPELLARCTSLGLKTNPDTISYYLGRETLIPRPDGTMMMSRKRLFGYLSKNARSATDFFSIPPNRVVEIGTQIVL